MTQAQVNWIIRQEAVSRLVNCQRLLGYAAVVSQQVVHSM